jgi:hypothetical protein
MVLLDKSIVIDNNELEQLREYDKDFDYFNDNYDEFYRKYRNEFVAVKNRRIFNHKNPLNLLEILYENNVDPVHTIIEFIKDKRNSASLLPWIWVEVGGWVNRKNIRYFVSAVEKSTCLGIWFDASFSFKLIKCLVNYG